MASHRQGIELAHDHSCDKLSEPLTISSDLTNLRPAGCSTSRSPARLEREPGGELDLARRPVGRLETFDAVRRIRVNAALQIENVEGIEVESQLDLLGNRENFIQ